VIVYYLHYPFVVANSATTQPTRHSAVLSAKSSKTEWFRLNLINVHCQDLACLGTINVDAAAGRIAGSQLLGQSLVIGIIVQPWTTIHLSYDFELPTGVYA